MNNMLVFDSAYSYADLRTRHLEEFVLARDQGNHFDNIVTIHPFAGVQFSNELDTYALYGAPQIYRLDDRNLFIEGKRGRVAWLRKFELLNYGLSLISILRLVLISQRKYKFSVVRSEDALLNGFIAWVISSILKVPLIIGVWGNSDAIRKQTGRPMMPRIFRSKRLEEKWEKFILMRAQVVLVGNDDNSRSVTAKGISSSKMRVLPVAFNLNPLHFIKPSDRGAIEDVLSQMQIEDKNLIVCISRLEPVKLVDHVLRAAPFIRPQVRDFRILILGDGSQLTELTSLSQELGIRDKVIFCGNQDQDWISRLIARVDVVASPLTGRALAECAMGGSAIVAYDIDWQGELIQTGKTGELVPYLDYVAMGESISHFLEDPEYKKSMGVAARNEILRKMSAIDISSTMNSIYTEVEKMQSEKVRRRKFISKKAIS